MSQVICAFLSTGFKEGQFIYLVDRLRESNFKVTLVGQSMNSVKGSHGIFVRPDLKVAQAIERQQIGGLILPGNYQSLATLMIDPRIVGLVTDQLYQTNPVVILGKWRNEFAELFCHTINQVDQRGFKTMEEESLDEFIDNLISLCRAS